MFFLFLGCELDLGGCCVPWLNGTSPDNCTLSLNDYSCSCDENCVENENCCYDFREYCDWEGLVTFYLKIIFLHKTAVSSTYYLTVRHNVSLCLMLKGQFEVLCPF